MLSCFQLCKTAVVEKTDDKEEKVPPCGAVEEEQRSSTDATSLLVVDGVHVTSSSGKKMVPVRFGYDESAHNSSIRCDSLVKKGYTTDGVMDKNGFVWYVQGETPRAEVPGAPHLSGGEDYLWKLINIHAPEMEEMQKDGYIPRNCIPSGTSIWMCKKK